MLGRNGLDYLTDILIVYKIYNGQAISKRESLHSSVIKFGNGSSNYNKKLYKLLKKKKQTKNKANQLNKEALL